MTGNVESTEASEVIPMQRMIIGKDDRAKVTNPNNLPFSAVCYLQYSWQKDSRRFTGSGVLVSDGKLITAAHNLYHPDFGWATNMTVKPGGANSKFSPINISSLNLFYNDWGRNPFGVSDDSSKFGFDIGLITLRSTTNAGYLGVKAPTDAEILNKDVYTFGYPGDLAKGIQYFSMGKILSTTSNTINYNNDTASGYSGGPVTLLSSYTIVGLSAFGDFSDDKVGSNGGPRITKQVAEYISDY